MESNKPVTQIEIQNELNSILGIDAGSDVKNGVLIEQHRHVDKLHDEMYCTSNVSYPGQSKWVWVTRTSKAATQAVQIMNQMGSK